jgi:hypothetical protein
VNVAANVLVSTMLDGFVRNKMFICAAIEATFGSHQPRFFGDVVHDNLAGSRFIRHGDVDRANIAAALDQRNNGALV